MVSDGVQVVADYEKSLIKLGWMLIEQVTARREVQQKISAPPPVRHEQGLARLFLFLPVKCVNSHFHYINNGHSKYLISVKRERKGNCCSFLAQGGLHVSWI